MFNIKLIVRGTGFQEKLVQFPTIPRIGEEIALKPDGIEWLGRVDRIIHLPNDPVYGQFTTEIFIEPDAGVFKTLTESDGWEKTP